MAAKPFYVRDLYVSGNSLLGSSSDNGVDRLQVTGSSTITGQIKSTLATGTAPFVIASTTLVTNLNAEMLGGKLIGTSGNTVPLLDGANTWSGTNRFNSNLAMSAATSASINLRLNSNITGATTSYGTQMSCDVQSGVTTAGYGFSTLLGTQATAFTLTTLYHFNAAQATIGAGSTVTTQIGFNVASTLTGAGTTNIGFQSNIASSTDNWNYRADGTAPNKFGGALAIGTVTVASLVGTNLFINKTITGAVTSYGVRCESVIQSDVTTAANLYTAAPSTVAGTYTIATLRQYYAITSAPAIAAVTITNQRAFEAGNLTGGTNNVAFYGGVDRELGTNPGLTTRTITNIALTSNVVTVTTSAAHGFVVGQRVTVAATTNTAINGSGLVIVSTPLTTTFTYARTNANITSVADTGSVIPQRNYNLFLNGTADNYFAGKVGIGSQNIGASHLSVGLNLTGAGSASVILVSPSVQSDVANVAVFDTFPGTQTATFTISQLINYRAGTGNIGVGCTIAALHGFQAGSLTAATNNYAFYGTTGIEPGTQTFAARTITNVDVTTNVVTVTTSVAHGFVATQKVTVAATTNTGINGSGITIASTPTTTTFTYSRTMGNITSVADTGSVTPARYWNLYMAGTADNYLGGSLAIGSTFLTGTTLRVSKTMTGATTVRGAYSDGPIQSVATTAAYLFATTAITQATSFTLPELEHFRAEQGTFGAGSTVTTQYGFRAASSLSGGGTNQGFRGDIAAASTNWNLYMNGTAKNYLAGTLLVGSNSDNGTDKLQVTGTSYFSSSVGIGITPSSTVSLQIFKTLTNGTTVQGIMVDGVVQSGVTVAAQYYRSNAATVAASFTLTTLSHFIAVQGTFGAGSTVTSQIGYHVDSTLTGATNNYGFRSQIAAAANRWNLYMDGTALNHLAGALLIGSTTDDTVNKLQVTGSANITSTLTIESGLEAGYKNIPRDVSSIVKGKVFVTAAGFTLNTGSAADSTYSVYNNSASAITITQGSGLTLRVAGTATTGNYSLAQRGWVTIWFQSTTEAIIL